MSKVILITGASRGFGRIWAEAFLKRGDHVIATARNLEALSGLTAEFGDRVLPLRLDVTDREACFQAINAAVAHFGHIDVLINNAGIGLFGAVEESSEQEARAQMETNFFGVLWLTQAVLPVMRQQGSGHIIQVSSVLGLVTVPVLGVYNASKFAVEGLSASLAAEVKSLGINVSIVEPNAYTTDWSTSADKSQAISAYQPVKDVMWASFTTPGYFGEPSATTPAIFKLVDAAEPPLRLLLGKVGYPIVKQEYEARLNNFEDWLEVSEAAHGNQQGA
ncbi:SDR family NAD(P)-dependent oxidoreductase [Pedobacter heparinus]|uniref:SDR family NAD(P)-dependent oxidoreductase n=1 Tax=Pedobacter heparinus TaxID=984 RepID=UPI00292D40BB|nr:SDR family NAD(P)-dependent oxidoreductase [Pedobacter heparinus]